MTTNVTVNFILSLRKFVSLTFSIIYYQNPFTFYHFCGTVLVLVGTFLYTAASEKSKKKPAASDPPNPVHAPNNMEASRQGKEANKAD